MKTKLVLSLIGGLLAVVTHAQTPDEIEGLILTGQVEPGKTALAAYAEAHPEAPELAYLEARLAVAEGDTAAGLEQIRELVATAPEQAQLHAALGTTLVRHAQTLPFMESSSFFMEAITAYRKAVELDADCLEGQMGLANYYLYAPEMAGGSLVRAEEHAREVVRLNPALGEPLLQQIQARKAGTNGAPGPGAPEQP